MIESKILGESTHSSSHVVSVSTDSGQKRVGKDKWVGRYDTRFDV
jgi:hypothetical protein